MSTSIAFHRILAPTDFSEHARPALRFAAALAEKFGAELQLLHVLADIVPVGPDPTLVTVLPPEYYAESEERCREALKNALDPAWGTPPTVTTHVTWGGAVEGVLSHAAEHKNDLIVIATHGRTGFSHVLLGSVAERIVREAPCPVLTIRSSIELPGGSE